MAKLVIIRGNSGSGKSSLAGKLQTHYGRGTLLISQDTVRRDTLKEKVEPGNLSIGLTETLARFGYEHDLMVLIEGFYETDIYGQMIERLKKSSLRRSLLTTMTYPLKKLSAAIRPELNKKNFPQPT